MVDQVSRDTQAKDAGFGAYAAPRQRCEPNLLLATSMFLIFLVPNIILPLVFGIVLYGATFGNNGLSGYAGAIWGAAAAYALTLWAVYLNFRSDEGVILHSVGWRWPAHRLQAWLPMLAVFFGLIILGGSLYEQHLGQSLQQEITDLIRTIINSDWYPTAGVTLLLVCVLGPLVEELVFRGYLQSALNRHLPSWMAISLSSLVFAAIHFDLPALPVLLLAGVCLGTLYQLTRSLLPPVILHMAVNTYGVVNVSPSF
ncbi:MAG: CPBP family intramembrane metalloprotease [Alphaproteobacteria bacterium]|nr:CPBP family intramembrane metalloprotease [Alphaproteobacteria bacterium]